MPSKAELIEPRHADDEGAPFDLRLMLALSEAGYSSLLSWREIDHVLTLAERFQHLADVRFWSIYLALKVRA